ncbi:MAG: hypothetical protein R3B90_02795 [Planctomycetaceae bacterium]
MHRPRLYHVLCAGLLGISAIGLAGCGSGEQQYSEQEMVTTTPADEAKAWLNGVKSSGELDSGAELMKETFAKVDSPNKDQLVKGLEEMINSAGNPSVVKKKATELLKLLE